MGSGVGGGGVGAGPGGGGDGPTGGGGGTFIPGNPEPIFHGLVYPEPQGAP